MSLTGMANEVLKMRLHGLPIRGVEGDIGDQRPAIDERLAHRFHFLGEPLPILINIIGKFAQGKEIAHAASLVVDPARPAELRAQAVLFAKRCPAAPAQTRRRIFPPARSA